MTFLVRSLLCLTPFAGYRWLDSRAEYSRLRTQVFAPKRELAARRAR